MFKKNFLGAKKFGGHKRNLGGRCPLMPSSGYGLADKYPLRKLTHFVWACSVLWSISSFHVFTLRSGKRDLYWKREQGTCITGSSTISYNLRFHLLVTWLEKKANLA